MDTIHIDSRGVKMVAHRGVSGLEKENTASAFVAAGNRSYFGIETDVHRTLDGHFVCIHDDTTGRVAIDNLKIEESTFDTLRALLLCDKDGAKGRIYATTDKSKGALRNMSDEEGYETFVVPDNVGGRYSVLTAVGLLPIAVAGIDIDALMKGAADAREQYMSPELDKNDCYRYAAIRNILYRSGKKIEMMAAYEPDYTMMCEWFKQLFGESEGKEHKGIFPASAIFSTDLHSLGQYIQQGERSLFETVVTFAQPKRDLVIEATADNEDGLNFLAGKHMSEVNRKAFEGTVLAHTDGGVPNILLDVDKMDEYNLGWLIYFLEKACGISGYVLGVNPFDQPGVESYKLNMFALMGKPGYEERRAELENRINF